MTSKELVNNLTDKYQFINIKEHEVTIRPLVSKLQRMIFSNVSPDIPNHIFEDILEKLKVQRGSRVTHVKATISNKEYSHVVSFRRQVYIKHDDIEKTPETFKLNYNELNYFIFFSPDILRCFTCKLEGHIAKNCPNSANDSINTSTNTQSDLNTTNSPTIDIVNTQQTDKHSDDTPQQVERINFTVPSKFAFYP